MINVPILTFVFTVMFASVGMFCLTIGAIDFSSKKIKQYKEKRDKELNEKIVKQFNLIVNQKK